MRAGSLFCLGGLLSAALHTPAPASIVTGTDAGAPAHVKRFVPAENLSFLPYGSFAGGVRVASADFNGDGTAEIVTGSGEGATHVKVFNGQTNAEIHSFFAYPGFTGGVYVAAGDVTGDGRADLITGAGPGGGPHVKVIDGTSLAEKASFFAYGAGFTGGVRVAAGDVNGDTFLDVITAPGPGSSSQVKVFDAKTNAEIRSFSAYRPDFTAGVYVAAGDLNGDGRAEIVTGPGEGAAGDVRVLDGVSLQLLESFFPYGTGFTGGIRVAMGDVTGDNVADIITGTGPGSPAHVKTFDGQTFGEVHSFLPYGSFTGGVFVAGVTAIPEPAIGLALPAVLLLARRRPRA